MIMVFRGSRYFCRACEILLQNDLCIVPKGSIPNYVKNKLSRRWHARYHRITWASWSHKAGDLIAVSRTSDTLCLLSRNDCKLVVVLSGWSDKDVHLWLGESRKQEIPGPVWLDSTCTDCAVRLDCTCTHHAVRVDWDIHQTILYDVDVYMALTMLSWLDCTWHTSMSDMTFDCTCTHHAVWLARVHAHTMLGMTWTVHAHTGAVWSRLYSVSTPCCMTRLYMHTTMLYD